MSTHLLDQNAGASTGKRELDEPSNPELGDVLDDLGCDTHGGRTVVLVPTECMPTGSGVVAINCA